MTSTPASIGGSKDTRWPAFAVCTAVAVLTILDLAKVNVTLAPISHTLGTGATETQLIVAGYVLAFGIALVPAGRLGDVWNRKALFAIGLAVFTGASLLCALAPVKEVLVGARLLQGLAAGILMPQVLGLVQQLFQGAERGRAFGIFGASIGLGTAFGPTVGGLLIGTLGEELGWRWTFGMNVPLALILLVLALRLLPAAQPRSAGTQLDLVGVGLLASTVLLVMLPFVFTTGRSDDVPARWFLLIGAAITGAAFVAWERRYARVGKTPVIDFALFRTSSYRYGVLITTCFFMAMPAVFLVVTLFLMQGQGHPALVAGLVSVPYALVSAVSAAVLGRYTHRFAPQLVVAGVGTYLVGIAGVLVVAGFADPEHAPLLVAAVFAISGAGAGAVMGANQMRTLVDVPLSEAGVAGSFQQVGQRLGNAVGVAVTTSTFFAGIAAAGGEGVADLESYRHTMTLCMTILLGVVGVTLILAIVDLVGARRRGRTSPAEPPAR